MVLLGGTLALSSELAVGTAASLNLTLRAGPPLTRSRSCRCIGTSVSLELTLPIATSGEEEPARPPSARSPQSPLPRFSVLLVEDNDFNVEVCKQLLEHMGQRVSVAMDGRDAVGAVVSSLADGDRARGGWRARSAPALAPEPLPPTLRRRTRVRRDTDGLRHARHERL